MLDGFELLKTTHISSLTQKGKKIDNRRIEDLSDPLIFNSNKRKGLPYVRIEETRTVGLVFWCSLIRLGRRDGGRCQGALRFPAFRLESARAARRYEKGLDSPIDAVIASPRPYERSASVMSPELCRAAAAAWRLSSTRA